MNPIELNKDEVKMLEEMITELFPEYTTTFRSRFQEAGYIAVMGHKHLLHYLNIHWLELCLYHIIPEIGAAPETILVANPVSSLYEIFCRTKKNC